MTSIRAPRSSLTSNPRIGRGAVEDGAHPDAPAPSTAPDGYENGGSVGKAISPDASGDAATTTGVATGCGPVAAGRAGSTRASAEMAATLPTMLTKSSTIPCAWRKPRSPSAPVAPS